MRVYIGNTGHIKNHQHFKILFWSRESEKPIFAIFPDFFYEKMGREFGNLAFTLDVSFARLVSLGMHGQDVDGPHSQIALRDLLLTRHLARTCKLVAARHGNRASFSDC